MRSTDERDGRSLLIEALTWLYDRVVGDMSHTAPAPGSERDIDRWIRSSCTQAGAAGFVTNIGGLMTLPIAIPANLAGTTAVQMRLIARIAAARGYDTQSEEVKTFVFACLLGNAAADVLKDVGLRLGTRVGQRALRLSGPVLSGSVLQRLNHTIGGRLLARFGAQGAFSATKVIPVVSGLIGGGLDAASTRVVGLMAKRVFPRRPAEPPATPPPLAIEAG